MRRLALALVVAGAAGWLSASPAAAGSACGQDGVATLCVTARQVQDVLAIDYQVSQYDGPGTYSLYYVDATGGSPSTSTTIGPLGFQGLSMGTLYAELDHCYNVHLDSTPGTALVVGPVCQ
jgi:hypothetical protein